MHLYAADPRLRAVRDLDRVAPTQDEFLTAVYSADGSRIIYLVRDGSQARVMTMSTTGSRRRVLFRAPGVALLAASPDGTELAFQSGKTLFVSRLNGTHRRVLSADLAIESLRWSVDGTTLYAMGHNTNPPFVCDGLCSIDVGTGKLRTVRRDHTAQYDEMSVSPGGTRAAFYDFTGPAGIAVIGMNGRNFHKVVVGYDPIWSPDGTKLAYTAWGPPEIIKVYDFASQTSRILTKLDPDEALTLLDWQSLQH